MTEIPPAECQVLADLYDSTGGDGWFDNSNWLVSSAPSTWYGVTVESGHVTQLLLNGNNLTGSLTPALGNLTSLAYLSLEYNNLSGSLPLTLIHTPMFDLRYNNTNLCKPPSPAFTQWHDHIEIRYNSGLNCATTDTTHIVAGRVWNTEVGLSGATVTVGTASAVSTFYGYYAVYVPTDGTYWARPAKGGFSFTPSWSMVTLPQGQDGVDFTGVPGSANPPGSNDEPPAIDPDKPYVTGVTPCISGPYYFPTIGALDNTFSAAINWQSLTPQSATFKLHDVDSVETASGDTVSHTYSMTNDFGFNPFNPLRTLTVTARAANGAVSDPFTFNAYTVNVPTWLPFSTITVTTPSFCQNKPEKLEATFVFPNPAFEGKVTPPTWFPFIGGKPLGIKETQAGLKAEIQGSGEGSIGIFGQTGFEAGGATITGKLTGSGKVQISPENGMQLTGAAIEFELAGKIELAKPVVELICGAATAGACRLRDAEAWPIIGGLVKLINQTAQIKLTIEPALTLTANLRSEAGGLAWESGEGSLSLKLTLSLVFEFIKDQLTAEVYGGGKGTLTLWFPPNPSYLKELKGELFGGLKFKVFAFERTFETSYEWVYSPSAKDGGELGVIGTTDSGWAPEKRAYGADASTYAVFQANKSAWNAKPLGLGETTETLMASNVYPQGNPAVVRAGSDIFLFWVHDNTSLPVLQSKEIYFSRMSGGTWSPPAGVTNDTLLDFAPQAAVDKNGHVLLVWERNRNQQPADADLTATYTNGYEIVWSLWNGSAWSPITRLTDNAVLDHAPVLAQGADGNLLLVWRENAAGELLGSAASDIFFSTIWDGSGFQDVYLVTSGTGILTVSPARYDANAMAIAYARDLDGDLTTDADQELYLQQWTGTAWGAAQRLTNDALSDRHPTFLYAADGSPRLVWLKGDQMVGLLGSLSGTPQPLALDASAGILDYAAAQNAAGRMVLVWQGLSEEGVDAFYAAYDEASALFSQALQLTHDRPLEKFMAPLIGADGNLLMAFNRTELVDSTYETASGTVITQVTTLGQTDLYLLSHAFGPDLALADADLRAIPRDPTPGSTVKVYAVLRNLGDQAVPTAAVSFYVMDSSLGMTLIGTVQPPEALPGGATATVSIETTLPASGAPFTIYATADAAGTVAESDETNNQAVLPLALPDLEVTDVTAAAPAGGTIPLSAVVKNNGISAAAATTLDFRLDDPASGTLLGSVPVGALEVGSQTLVSLDWNPAAASDGSYKVYAVANPGGAPAESDRSNNSAWTAAAVLPDLNLETERVLTTLQPDGSLLVSVWVKNNGLRTAQNITLGLYNRPPQPGSLPLSSVTLTVAPGATYAAGLTLANYPFEGFYIGAGYDEGYQDAKVSDNLLVVGNPPRIIYLPVVRR